KSRNSTSPAADAKGVMSSIVFTRSGQAKRKMAWQSPAPLRWPIVPNVADEEEHDCPTEPQPQRRLQVVEVPADVEEIDLAGLVARNALRGTRRAGRSFLMSCGRGGVVLL